MPLCSGSLNDAATSRTGRQWIRCDDSKRYRLDFNFFIFGGCLPLSSEIGLLQ